MDKSSDDTPKTQAENAGSESSSTSTASETHKAVRSPAEKWIVRGLIIVLVAFAAIEARARFGYEQTLAGIQETFEDDENKEDTKISDLDPVIKLFPSRETGSENGKHWVTLKWFSFIRTFQIKLNVGNANDDDPVVLSFTTQDAEQNPVKKKELTPNEADENPPGGAGPEGMSNAPGAGSGPGGGGPGGGGGGRRFDPQAIATRIMGNDKDKDGKLTKKEIGDNERAQQLFDRADTDKDGFVTKEDLEKALANRPRRKKRSGGGGRPEGKRKRPEAEKTPAKTTKKKAG
ncbi:MAG: hypothetical protein Tsb009_06030 [Planctomycetaceae bacterium]